MRIRQSLLQPSQTGMQAPWKVQWMGKLKQGSEPHIEAIESKEKRLRLSMKQLVCGSLNGMRIRQSLPQPYIHWAGTWVSWKGSSWELELGSNPRASAAVDCEERNRGDVREGIVVQNACGGKPGSHGSKAILLSHA